LTKKSGFIFFRGKSKADAIATAGQIATTLQQQTNVYRDLSGSLASYNYGKSSMNESDFGSFWFFM